MPARPARSSQTPIHLFQSQPFRLDPNAPVKQPSTATEASTFRRPLMSNFQRKSYPSTERLHGLGARYRRLLANHPFFMFGLPFIGLMVAGSFFLTPATAVRYEKFDRKTHMLDRDEALGLGRVREAGKKRGKRDIREEYWRLAGKDSKLDEWEPKRVKRLPGEPDGTFE